VIKRVAVDGQRPEIPAGVNPGIRDLIEDCWAQNAKERLQFEMILDRLKQLEFKVTAGVKSAKVRRFVEAVELWEREHGIEIDDFA
jgi:hypothetical protein